MGSRRCGQTMTCDLEKGRDQVIQFPRRRNRQQYTLRSRVQAKRRQEGLGLGAAPAGLNFRWTRRVYSLTRRTGAHQSDRVLAATTDVLETVLLGRLQRGQPERMAGRKSEPVRCRRLAQQRLWKWIEERTALSLLPVAGATRASGRECGCHVLCPVTAPASRRTVSTTRDRQTPDQAVAA